MLKNKFDFDKVEELTANILKKVSEDLNITKDKCDSLEEYTTVQIFVAAKILIAAMVTEELNEGLSNATIMEIFDKSLSHFHVTAADFYKKFDGKLPDGIN